MLLEPGQAGGVIPASDSFFELTLAIVHPHAADVLREESTMRATREWLLKRLMKVKFNMHEDDTVYPSVNAWNSQGYGLQSVSITVIDSNQNPKREPGEWKDPTIGIVAPGMLGREAENAVTDFDIDAGKAEECQALSSHGIMLQAVAKGHDPRATPDRLPFGHTTVARGPKQVMRTVVELAKDPNGPRQKIMAVLQNGVYACRFLIQQ